LGHIAALWVLVMVDPYRLVKPQLHIWSGAAHLPFRQEMHFLTSGEPVLVTDPIYLADVYNSEDSLACFVREQGVIVNDFGGDITCPVVWQPPFLMLVLDDTEFPEPSEMPLDAVIVASKVGCDSGSFVFLPLAEGMPAGLRTTVADVVARNNGVALPLPAGRWSVWYEDWQDYHGRPRKIVARWQTGEATRPVQFPLLL